jgi:hypothetical protein
MPPERPEQMSGHPAIWEGCNDTELARLTSRQISPKRKITMRAGEPGGKPAPAAGATGSGEG